MGPASDYDISTIRRHLREAGCRTIRPASCPFLNKTQQKKRLEWANSHRHFSVDDWKKVVFSDETVLQIADNCPQYVLSSFVP